MASASKEKCMGCGEMVQFKSDGGCPRCGTKRELAKQEPQAKSGFTSSALDHYIPPIYETQACEPLIEVIIDLTDLISELDDCVVCAENRRLGRPICLICSKRLISEGAV